MIYIYVLGFLITFFSLIKHFKNHWFGGLMLCLIWPIYWLKNLLGAVADFEIETEK